MRRLKLLLTRLLSHHRPKHSRLRFAPKASTQRMARWVLPSWTKVLLSECKTHAPMWKIYSGWKSNSEQPNEKQMKESSDQFCGKRKKVQFCGSQWKESIAIAELGFIPGNVLSWFPSFSTQPNTMKIKAGQYEASVTLGSFFQETYFYNSNVLYVSRTVWFNGKHDAGCAGLPSRKGESDPFFFTDAWIVLVDLRQDFLTEQWWHWIV